MDEIAGAQAVVVGGGPAGSVTAMELARRGIDTVVVEREGFPRFHIGESLTGEAGQLLRRLGLDAAMDAAPHQVKHGVSVYGAKGRNRFWVPIVGIAADGGREPMTSWQVRRATFDRQLLDHAQAQGATLVRGSAVEPVVVDGRVRGVRVELEGEERELSCEVLVDATGQRRWLARSGFAGPMAEGRYDRQIAVFTHLVGAERDPGEAAGNTIIFYQRPYHWSWFIPIDDEVTSVGTVVPSGYFRAQGQSPEEFLTRELRELNPELTERMANVTFVDEPHVIVNYSYQVEEFTGPGWMCVGDAHRFTDPVFSFGVHLATHEAERAAATIADALAAPADEPALFDAWADWAEGGQDVIAAVIDAFWSNPLAFGLLITERHREEMVDLLAGRIYGIDDPGPGLQALQRLAAPPVEA